MYAVVRTGGKQYCVEPNSSFEIERIEGATGDTVSLTDVLLVASDAGVTVGKPCIDGARVEVEILDQMLGNKTIIYKKIRRHGKRLKKGHRQQLTRVRVKEIAVAK